MKLVFLVFAFLAALAAPAAAEDSPYESTRYEGAPGPLIYSTGEEPEWLGRVLTKLEKPRKPRVLRERLVFRDANGPTHLYGPSFARRSTM